MGKPGRTERERLSVAQIAVGICTGLALGLIGASVAWPISPSTSAPLAATTSTAPRVWIMTVEVDKPVTVTITPTETMMAWELTAEARPTHTPTIVLTSTPWIWRTSTPLPPLQNQTVSDTEG